MEQGEQTLNAPRAASAAIATAHLSVVFLFIGCGLMSFWRNPREASYCVSEPALMAAFFPCR